MGNVSDSRIVHTVARLPLLLMRPFTNDDVTTDDHSDRRRKRTVRYEENG